MRLLTTNLCTEAATTVTASSSNSNFPASNLKHPFRSKRLRTASGVTSLNVVFDFQTVESINSVVFLWPKEDGIRLTSTATLKIQANATNVWTSPAVDQTLTIDNDYVLASHFFSTDQSYRYWRVVIQDAGNPWDYIELGAVWIGKSLEVENAQNGFKYSLVDQTKNTVTDFGHKYSDEYPLKAVIEFQYQYLDYDAVVALENAYRQNGSRKPVLLVIDPEETVFSKNHLLVYGTMGSGFASTHVNFDLFNSESIVIEELF